MKHLTRRLLVSLAALASDGAISGRANGVQIYTVAGFAKGEANVQLTPEGDSPKLSYGVKASIGGKLAQVGARLIDGVAKKMAEQFFNAFNKRASGPAEN